MVRVIDDTSPLLGVLSVAFYGVTASGAKQSHYHLLGLLRHSCLAMTKDRGLWGAVEEATRASGRGAADYIEKGERIKVAEKIDDLIASV